MTDWQIHPDAPTDEEGHPVHPEKDHRICARTKSDQTTSTDHGRERDDIPYCTLAAGWGVDGRSDGACDHHGGSGGAPENNGNAETHGLTADGEKWFERHRDEVEDDVRLMVAGWMREAPFGYENHGNVQLLVDAAINECQIRRGDEYIREEGMVVNSFDRIADDGREVWETKENPAFKPKSRLQRDTVRILEKLGILDDPETQNAESRHDVADALREALDS